MSYGACLGSKDSLFVGFSLISCFCSVIDYLLNQPDFWDSETLAYCSVPKVNFASYDPLRKSIAIWARPVSILIYKWIGLW